MRLGELYDALEQIGEESAPSEVVEAVLAQVADMHAPDHYEVLKRVLQHPQFQVVYTGTMVPREMSDAAASEEAE